MKNTLKNIKVKDLSHQTVSYKTVEFDMSEGLNGHDYDTREACRCDKCGEVLVDTCGDSYHNRLESTDCDGWVEAANGICMSFGYPIPSRPSDSAVASLEGLSLCVVYVGDTEENYLSLTGGGMDLSWDICEGYIRLGYLPPASMCQLPEYAGMELNADRKKIISACKESIRSAKRSLVSDLNRLYRLVSNLKDNTKK